MLLSVEAEKAVRDSRSAKELLERQQRLHEEEQKSTQATLRELTERLQVAVLGQEQEAAKRVDAQEQCKDSRISCDKLRAQVLTVFSSFALLYSPPPSPPPPLPPRSL